MTNSSQTASDCRQPGETITAAILVIGDEILSGRTKDKNIGFIAEYLTNIGIRLQEVRIVPDIEIEIVDAVCALKDRYSYVFTTGGIGPTHDDITADSIAKALGVGIDVDERALGLMKPYYERRGLPLTDSRLRMARIPFGAELIKNKVSIAPGFMIENVIVMAGVPSIMQVMLDDVAENLKTGQKMLSQTVSAGRPEGDIADMLSDHQKEFADISIGSYPSFRDGKLQCEIVLRSVDAARLQLAVESLDVKLKSL